MIAFNKYEKQRKEHLKKYDFKKGMKVINQNTGEEGFIQDISFINFDIVINGKFKNPIFWLPYNKENVLDYILNSDTMNIL